MIGHSNWGKIHHIIVNKDKRTSEIRIKITSAQLDTMTSAKGEPNFEPN